MFMGETGLKQNLISTCFPALSQKTLRRFEIPVLIWLKFLETIQIFREDHTFIVKVNRNKMRI